MSRLAIKEYLISQWSTAPNQTAILANQAIFLNVITLRQIPKIEKLGTGVFLITGPSMRREERLSGSRGAGQKKAIYRMRVWFYGVTKDEIAGGDAFDTCWENVLQVIRSTAVQRNIVDPMTNANSWLHDISEMMEDQVEEPRLSAAQGLVRFYAEGFINIEEVYTD